MKIALLNLALLCLTLNGALAGYHFGRARLLRQLRRSGALCPPAPPSLQEVSDLDLFVEFMARSYRSALSHGDEYQVTQIRRLAEHVPPLQAPRGPLRRGAEDQQHHEGASMSGSRMKALRRAGQAPRDLRQGRQQAGLQKIKGAASVVHVSPMEAQAIIERLDDRLAPAGELLILPAAAYEEIPQQDLVLWCHVRSYWLLPTQELVAWLRAFIGPRSALEICAGFGALGRALSIPRTDSQAHIREPAVRAIFEAMGQRGIPRYPPDVEPLEACAAVRSHRPDVVVCAWTAQRLIAGDPTRMAGSAVGVDEVDLFRRVEHYVLIGTEANHARDRKLFRRCKPAEILAPPWLWSRTSLRDDRIWVFHNPQPVREDAPAAAPPVTQAAPALPAPGYAPQRTPGESAPPSTRRLL